MSSDVTPPVFRAYGALMTLLVLTALATYLPKGPWALPIALGIATAKLALIFLYFMRLRYQRGLIRVFAIAGFFWLAIAGVLTFADYRTRGWPM
jgi:cytochrome c oxidase subunit 4